MMTLKLPKLNDGYLAYQHEFEQRTKPCHVTLSEPYVHLVLIERNHLYQSCPQSIMMIPGKRSFKCLGCGHAQRSTDVRNEIKVELTIDDQVFTVSKVALVGAFGDEII